jgi:hypothetical protein
VHLRCCLPALPPQLLLQLHLGALGALQLGALGALWLPAAAAACWEGAGGLYPGPVALFAGVLVGWVEGALASVCLQCQAAHASEVSVCIHVTMGTLSVHKAA